MSKSIVRLDIHMSRLDIHMSRLDIHMSRLDIHMSRLDIRVSVPTMLVLLYFIEVFFTNDIKCPLDTNHMKNAAFARAY